MKTAVEKLIAKYEKQWNKYGMGSVISYSQVVSDLKKLKNKEAEQIVEAWYSAYGGDAHHSGEAYYTETFKSESCSCDNGIIVCPGCDGDKQSEFGICAGCNGKGKVTCGKCGGKSKSE